MKEWIVFHHSTSFFCGGGGGVCVVRLNTSIKG